MNRAFFYVTCIVLATALALVPSCSSDSNTESDSGGDATTVDDTSDTGQTDNGQTEDTTPADETTADAADDATPDEPEPREVCGILPAQDETAVLYDIVTPLQKFIGTAELSLEGQTVTVDIIDETDEFVGDFDEEHGNCILVDVDALSADLCFHNADGTPAADASLGANLYGFIHGAPHTSPSATLIGAVRRGVDRSCSPGGFYTFELEDDLSIDGDLAEEVSSFVQEDFLQYFALFDLGNDKFSAVVSVEEPTEEQLQDGDPIGGDIQIFVPTGFEVEVDADDLSFDLDFELVGTADFDEGTISGTVTLTVDGDSTSGELSASFTASRP